jgi:2-oxoglutarate ferredoxin oxidoreductase subunit beta
MTSTHQLSHPADSFLREESIPSVWCPGCGIGTVVNTFVETLTKSNIDLDKVCISSGIGCTGKIADYLELNCSSATDGDAIKCAVQLKKKNPEKKAIVFLNDTDFLASGAEGLIEAGANGVELVVIYINNFIYIVTESKTVPVTPFLRSSTNGIELPFNIPRLADSSDALYVARWTPLHVRRLMHSISEAMSKPGLSVIEIISPCLMYYASNGKIGETIDRMRFFRDHTVIKHGEPTENLDIRNEDNIIIGKFVDR